MRDPEYLARLEADLALLTRLSNALPGALSTARQDAAGIRAQNYEGVIVSGHTVSDPTGQAAIAPGRIDIAVAEIHAALDRIHSVVEPLIWNCAWLTRSPVTHAEARRREDERRDLADGNRHRCWSCARVEASPGLPWDCGCPELRRTDCGGILDEPRPLCRWTVRYVERFGELPTVDEVELHRRGGRVRKTA